MCIRDRYMGIHYKKIMKNLLIISIVCAIALTASARWHWPWEKPAPLDVVQFVDLQRYLGRWYEIARFPMSKEDGLVCITANYSLNQDKTIKVENSGRKGTSSGEVSGVTGKAWTVNDGHSKLKVQFFWPFSGDYWIIDLDADYQWALIGEPWRENGWILSRSPQLDVTLLEKLIQKFEQKGWDISLLSITEQSCQITSRGILLYESLYVQQSCCLFQHLIFILM
eukprot:TRINITY_DN476_c0_g1_i6.p1 TRINITY_DN476_c0_g1~~TRINITY_DN476_c0_g1_i6.p1  ORF type:complete len:241 (-),score=54.02 TRINITY_DN476_c0_g1_i6:89-763(-)